MGRLDFCTGPLSAAQVALRNLGSTSVSLEVYRLSGGGKASSPLRYPFLS